MNEKTMRLREAIAYTILFSIIFILIIFFKGAYLQDINLHSASAHIIYKIIVENDQYLSNFFSINLFTPGAIYYIYYIIAYFFIKSSFWVSVLFYFIYFMLWGVGSYFILKNVNRLNQTFFMISLLLSLNSGIAYGMPSFMISEALFMLSFGYFLKFFNERNRNIMFVLSIIFSYFFFWMHPIVGILSTVVFPFYTFYDKEKKEVNLITYFLFGFVIALSFLFIYFILNPLNPLSLKPEGDMNIFTTILYYFFISKMMSIVTINYVLFFSLFLPLLFLFLSERGKWNFHVKVIYFILIIILIFPENLGYAYLFSGRFLTFLLLFLLISFPYKKNGMKFYKIIFIIVFVINVMAPFFYENILRLWSMDYFHLFDNKNKSVNHYEDNQLYPILKSIGVKKYFSFYASSIYGETFDDIDNGIISSSMYTSKMHPLSHKNITTFYEVIKLPLGGTLSNKSRKKYCNILNSEIEDVCSFYDYVLVKYCQLPLHPVLEVEEGKNVSNVILYKCN